MSINHRPGLTTGRHRPWKNDWPFITPPYSEPCVGFMSAGLSWATPRVARTTALSKHTPSCFYGGVAKEIHRGRLWVLILAIVQHALTGVLRVGVHIHAGSVWPCVQGHAVHPRVWRPFELYKRYPGREKDVRLNRHRAKLQLATMFTKPRNQFSSRCLISWPLRKKIRTKKWIAQSYPFNVRNFYFLVVILPSEHFEM